MPRKSEDFVKVTIRLRRGDKERLAEYYPRKGYNGAIRELVALTLRKLDERTSRMEVDISPTNIDL